MLHIESNKNNNKFKEKSGGGRMTLPWQKKKNDQR